jgi:hypothetical protein
VSRTKKGQLRKGHSSISRGHDEFVSIYCRGTVEAPHDKWKIASFMPADHNGERFWTESTSGYAETGSDALSRVYPLATQWLDGTEYIFRDADGRALVKGKPDAEVFYRDTFRTGWMLKCKTCDYAHKIGNPRDAYSLMDRLASLAEGHVFEVPVREFSRRVM